MEKRQSFKWGAYALWTTGTFFLFLEPAHVIAHLLGAHAHHEFEWLLGVWHSLFLATISFLIGTYFARGAHDTLAHSLVEGIVGWFSSKLDK